MNEEIKYMTYYRTFHDTMKVLDLETRGVLITALGDYVFEGKDPDFNGNKILEVLWITYKFLMDASMENFKKSSENGKKGGRPKKAETVETPIVETPKGIATEALKDEKPIIEIGEPVDEFDLMTQAPDVKPVEDNSFSFFGSSYKEPEAKLKRGRKPKVKEPKHQYGSCSNVELTDAELERLNNEYGKDKTDRAIEYLSTYKKEKNYVTHDDNLTLRRWVFDAINKQNNNNGYSTWQPKKEPDYGYEDDELKQIRERNRRDMEAWLAEKKEKGEEV